MEEVTRPTSKRRRRRRSGRRGETASRAQSGSDRLKESVIDPHRLARAYLRRWTEQEQSLIRRYQRQWWRYEDGLYRAMSEEETRADATRAIKSFIDRWASNSPSVKTLPRVTGRLVQDTLSVLVSETLLPDDRSQPFWLHSDSRSPMCVSMGNGIVDFERLLRGQQGLEPHTPLWFSPVKLPYSFEPSATCVRWLSFLDEVLESDEERITLLQEWCGYCLSPDTSHEKFLILVGDGANGKSVSLNTLNSLVGEANASHVPLDALGRNFLMVATLGKAVNSVSEMGETDSFAEHMLKEFLTANQSMQFERKHAQPFSARPSARLVFSTNTLPHFKDKTDGIWRRLMVLPFRVTIPLERRDLRLSDKLKEELPGIFNWAMEGLRRLRNQGRVTEPALSRLAIEDLRGKSDPARVFLIEAMVEDPSGEVSAEELSEVASRWCADRGYGEPSGADLGRALSQLFPRVKRKRAGSDGNRWLVYQGVTHVGVGDTCFHTDDHMVSSEKSAGRPDVADVDADEDGDSAATDEDAIEDLMDYAERLARKAGQEHG